MLQNDETSINALPNELLIEIFKLVSISKLKDLMWEEVFIPWIATSVQFFDIPTTYGALNKITSPILTTRFHTFPEPEAPVPEHKITPTQVLPAEPTTFPRRLRAIRHVCSKWNAVIIPLLYRAIQVSLRVLKAVELSSRSAEYMFAYTKQLNIDRYYQSDNLEYDLLASLISRCNNLQSIRWVWRFLSLPSASPRPQLFGIYFNP